MVKQHLEDQQESEIRTKLRNHEMEEIRHALILSRGKHIEAA